MTWLATFIRPCLWGFFVFVVFQKLISSFVLIGGLVLLALAVAQGESGGRMGGAQRKSGGGGGGGGQGGWDPRDGRAPGSAWGTRVGAYTRPLFSST